MKKVLLSFAILFMFLMALGTAEASGLAQKGQIAVGGDVMLGGVTPWFDGGDGAFAFGIEPMVMVFPIDNLAVFTRMPFWEGHFFKQDLGFGQTLDMDLHWLPFLFGVRYYYTIPSADAWQIYGGAGLGGAVATGDGGSEGYFAMDMHFGSQYEVIKNLGIDMSFDIFLPNIAPSQTGTKVTARFGVMGGVFYHFNAF